MSRRFHHVLPGLLLAAPMCAQPADEVLRLAQAPYESRDVLNTTDPAAPEAEEVIIDLPSAFHTTRFQRGYLGEWVYVIYPDGTAKILSGGAVAQRMYFLTCTLAVSCEITGRDGEAFSVPATREPRPAPPVAPDAKAAATYIARWILAGTGPEPVPEPEPEPVVVVSTPAPPVLTEEEQIALAEAAEAEAVENESDAELAAAAQQSEAMPPPSDLDEACPEVAGFLPDECHQTLAPVTVPPLIATPRTRPASSSAAQAATPSSSQTTAQTRAAPTAPAPEADQSFFERIKLSCAVTATTSLQDGSDNPTLSFEKPRASLGCSTNLTRRLSFRFALVGYLFPEDRASSDPDYTYAFNYKVSDKINLGYSNYSAQFGGENGNFLDGLLNGTLRASYKLPTIHLPNDKSLPCSASVALPDPVAKSFNLSCGYAVTDKLRVGGTAYLYAPDAQDTYDPDYSYSASYKVNDKVLVSYSNYSNNRWPWNKGDAPGPGILGGNLSLTYKFSF